MLQNNISRLFIAPKCPMSLIWEKIRTDIRSKIITFKMINPNEHSERITFNLLLLKIAMGYNLRNPAIKYNVINQPRLENSGARPVTDGKTHQIVVTIRINFRRLNLSILLINLLRKGDSKYKNKYVVANQYAEKITGRKDLNSSYILKPGNPRMPAILTIISE